MHSTIAVSKETMRMLADLKEKLGTKTHEETIKRMISNERLQILRSFRGALKGVKTEFKRESLDREFD